MKFPEYKQLDLSKITKEVLNSWKEENTFQQSIDSKEGEKEFIFYEGPPSANGVPGIHHVLARTVKDLFCRYKTLQGYKVVRKAGWDTHGLPVELSVEKKLKITKDDIGSKISIADYNKQCRSDVMKYTDVWRDLTEKMGYWVNLDEPYITYDNKYIESVWHLLKELYKKKLIYKGHSIQPYSPGAGTGLSTHELNQPGCYRDVKDTTVIAQFKLIKNSQSEFLFNSADTDSVHFLAWTTTPWTLPSNTALAVGKNIKYLLVKTLNPYSKKKIFVIVAEKLLDSIFDGKKFVKTDNFDNSDIKKIPYSVISEFSGSQLENIRYEQLLAYQQPTDGDAFKVIIGDFVTTEDGTGIVHIAPSFGADDNKVAKINKIGSLTLVNKKGQFIKEAGDLAGRFVKNEYDEKLTEKDETVDVFIAVKLKKEDKAFKIEKYSHSYPHCWRTDKPILYYPLESWFIKTTAVKDKLIKLNKTINWKPEQTGTGRFGKWLENLQDWNLSRSRFWGTPLPIWRTKDGEEEIIIGSVAELKTEINKAVEAGFMKNNLLDKFESDNFTKENYSFFDLHRPFVDDIVLLSKKGKKMHREADLIDVWFDSGAMPFAQYHYPFEKKLNTENKAKKLSFPADFIAEGVDQTRGWFFTMHAIAGMLFDSVAYKNIVSNGLVLDKKGQKMSKRYGNSVEPFEVIKEYGADCLRWYMISNSQVWDNLKFDIEGVKEVKRKFFGTLYNTYSFFSLYANVDNFRNEEEKIAINERPEIDRWIISLLNSLVKEVGDYYEDYEPTKVARAIQKFVIENLSNWFVRLSRKRYWGGEFDKDKLSAYQTLYECLLTIARLSAPIAPFYMDALFKDLTVHNKNVHSVHLDSFPEFDEKLIDKNLEERMEIAQTVSSLVLGLRRKVSLKVRQPLQKILIPIANQEMRENIEQIENLIKTEVNIKEIEYISDSSDIISKTIKANFKMLGRKYGKQMKELANIIKNLSSKDINDLETDGKLKILLASKEIELLEEEVEIEYNDIEGWLVAKDNKITVALDINITEELKEEFYAREFINKVQNLRKDKNFEVTDKINIIVEANNKIKQALENNENFIKTQTLADNIVFQTCDGGNEISFEEDLIVLFDVFVNKK